ncbi:MAG: pilin [Patescibacteria group bacterium]
MKKTIFLIFIFFFICIPAIVLAETCDSLTGVCNPTGGSENVTSIEYLIGKVGKPIMGLLGIISLLIFLYAGFIWMTARGNIEKIKTSRQIMLWAILGLVVIFSSYTILSYIFVNLP